VNSQPFVIGGGVPVPLLSLFVDYVIGGCIWVYVGTIMGKNYKLGINEKQE